MYLIFTQFFKSIFPKFTHKTSDFSKFLDIRHLNSFIFQHRAKTKKICKNYIFLQILILTALHDLFQLPLNFISSSKPWSMKGKHCQAKKSIILIDRNSQAGTARRIASTLVQKHLSPSLQAWKSPEYKQKFVAELVVHFLFFANSNINVWFILWPGLWPAINHDDF